MNCAEVFQKAIENLDASIKEHKARVTCDALPTVLANQTQMISLFQNLIGNGIKFHGKERPLVHVRAAETSEGVLFEFRDNGIGIREENISKLFALFQRLHDETEYTGTGRALLFCKRIVERHDGKIWVTSQLGSGSRFFVFLPKAKASS